MGFESSRDSWTRYWRGGNQDTCFTSIGTFSIAERWRAFFRELADGASILDLATGNGTVALLAARVSEERPIPFSITAVDQAAIDPAQSLREPPALLKSIAFIPDTMLEELPFDAARFDAVCSQLIRIRRHQPQHQPDRARVQAGSQALSLHPCAKRRGRQIK